MDAGPITKWMTPLDSVTFSWSAVPRSGRADQPAGRPPPVITRSGSLSPPPLPLPCGVAGREAKSASASTGDATRRNLFERTWLKMVILGLALGVSITDAVGRPKVAELHRGIREVQVLTPTRS